MRHFTFVRVSNKEISIVSGEMRGLSVILNSGQGTHVAAPRENAGFKLLIHPKDEFPNLQDLGFELELGTHAAVRIRTKEVLLSTIFQFFSALCTFSIFLYQ